MTDNYSEAEAAFDRISRDGRSVQGAHQAYLELVRAAAVGDPRPPHVVLAELLPDDRTGRFADAVLDYSIAYYVAVQAAGEGGFDALLDTVAEALSNSDQVEP